MSQIAEDVNSKLTVDESTEKSTFVRAPGEIPVVGSICMLRVEPGDVLVITTARRLSMKQKCEIESAFRSVVLMQKILVLEDGITLSVVAPQELSGEEEHTQ